MRRPKGFGKNYFTLAAIQATVVQHHLDATSVRVRASHLAVTGFEDEPDEEKDETQELLCSSHPYLPSHAGHCNCFYNRITRNRIRRYNRPKLLVQTYRYANSVTSPPMHLTSSHQQKTYFSGN
ncbi:MAG: hypothetical protein MUP09_05755 [Thiovulaceae bacterium]|nr:hypothetical protein [Sulfurimonadaceae bacterium]